MYRLNIKLVTVRTSPEELRNVSEIINKRHETCLHAKKEKKKISVMYLESHWFTLMVHLRADILQTTPFFNRSANYFNNLIDLKQKDAIETLQG